MGRLSFVMPACLIAFAMVAGGAACDSTLNLGDGADGGGGGGPDSAPPTCASTCDRLITTCRLFSTDQRSACIAECNQKGRPSDLACVAQTACGEILRSCGDGSGGDGSANQPDTAVLTDFEIRNCQSACDTSQFFDCITASELSTCRGLCETAPASKRNAYQACASGKGGNCPSSRDCFNVFAGD